METTTETHTSANLADRLKSETAILHDRAESHAFQQAFAAGKLPKETYIHYLEQMYWVYGALEEEIRKTRGATGTLSSVIVDRNFRISDLAADLEFFGCDMTQVEPCPAAQVLIDEIRATASSNPSALLGYHYVLEGSNNGSTFIARNIRRAYELTDNGVRYLDPYGEEQREVWAKYKQAMMALELPKEQADEIVQAAQSMFQGVASISAQVHASQQ